MIRTSEKILCVQYYIPSCGLFCLFCCMYVAAIKYISRTFLLKTSVKFVFVDLAEIFRNLLKVRRIQRELVFWFMAGKLNVHFKDCFTQIFYRTLEFSSFGIQGVRLQTYSLR
jgi:hypothetical protein